MLTLYSILGKSSRCGRLRVAPSKQRTFPIIAKEEIILSQQTNLRQSYLFHENMKFYYYALNIGQTTSTFISSTLQEVN